MSSFFYALAPPSRRTYVIYSRYQRLFSSPLNRLFANLSVVSACIGNFALERKTFSNVVFVLFVQAPPSRRTSVMAVPEVPFLTSFEKNHPTSQKYIFFIIVFVDIFQNKGSEFFFTTKFDCPNIVVFILYFLCSSVGSALASFVKFDKKYSAGANVVSKLNIL
jgi:hypothetical protein